ncbi:DUF3995 domain-containing protein [Actinomadura darangshiensis]|uniref:DUF3995 domain-containing protein n=1 Tax=Actinomadura darangshiensis TaxID=705336 RepID=A0A4R4ZS13_9ACTN|nr:DUF3995 domain-containing protein [Actinomadura darangshiensis]TDD61838.1 DUF3995 domain-containing protein [Actinomadura darangshiensis]
MDAMQAVQVRRGSGFGAYAAAAWGVLFALVHVYWVLGGRAGLPAGLDLHDNVPLLVIDVIAIPVSFAAAVLALAVVQPWGGRLPRKWLKLGVWGTAGLLLVHALPSVPDWVALAAGSKTVSDFSTDERFVTLLYEPWFITGGILFCLAGLAFRRR